MKSELKNKKESIYTLFCFQGILEREESTLHRHASFVKTRNVRTKSGTSYCCSFPQTQTDNEGVRRKRQDIATNHQEEGEPPQRSALTHP